MASNKRARQKARRRARLEAEMRRRRRRRTIVQIVGFFVVAAVVILILALHQSLAGSTTLTSDACPPGFSSSKRITHFSSAPPQRISDTRTYYAYFKTDAGTIKVRLEQNLAPVTVNSFVYLACHHFYDTTIFHRVVTNFVDQGGDPTGTGTGGPGYTLPDEYPTESNVRHPYAPGELAMANTGEPHSSGSQFFFVVGQSAANQLNQLFDAHEGSYTIFGEVLKGMNVVEKINNDGSASGKPVKVHRIVSLVIRSS